MGFKRRRRGAGAADAAGNSAGKPRPTGFFAKVLDKHEQAKQQHKTKRSKLIGADDAAAAAGAAAAAAGAAAGSLSSKPAVGRGNRPGRSGPGRGGDASPAATSKSSSRSASVVVVGTADFAQASVADPNPKAAGPFSSRDRILLVGEGNFTFAASLSTLLGGFNLVATSLDARADVLGKYGETARTALLNLRLAGARAVHDVDATSPEHLRRCLSLSDGTGDGTGGSTGAGEENRFDVVAFNFPHLGGATLADVKRNREMLRDFFTACRGVLAPGKRARVLVTLRSSPFYASWKVGALAEERGMKRVKEVPFDKALFPGYEEARTNPAVRDTPSTVSAITYVFAVARPKKS